MKIINKITRKNNKQIKMMRFISNKNNNHYLIKNYKIAIKK